MRLTPFFSPSHFRPAAEEPQSYQKRSLGSRHTGFRACLMRPSLVLWSRFEDVPPPRHCLNCGDRTPKNAILYQQPNTFNYLCCKCLFSKLRLGARKISVKGQRRAPPPPVKSQLPITSTILFLLLAPHFWPKKFDFDVCA